MICLGCYTESIKPFCSKCSKKLFGGIDMSPTLSFASPSPVNLGEYQINSKSLSISGAQLKYSLRLVGKTLKLTESGGQYILKPIPVDRQLEAAPDIPENEHLTMQIAEKVFNIETASNGIVYFNDGQPAYITKRFDLQADGIRQPQEDFAQLLNRTMETHGEHYKYDGSYEQMGSIINQYVSTSLPMVERLFKMVLFNYIISNGDGHLRNFSLIRRKNGEYLLSPAYDLLCTRIHTPLESDVALHLFKGDMEFSYYSVYGRYGRPEFIELARRMGIQKERATRIIQQFLKRVPQALTFIKKSTLSNESKTTYKTVLLGKVTAFD